VLQSEAASTAMSAASCTLRNELRSISATLDSVRRSLAVCRAIRSRLCDVWALEEPRSMEVALVDLRSRYAQQPTPALARMVELLEAELKERKAQAAAQPRSAVMSSAVRTAATTGSPTILAATAIAPSVRGQRQRTGSPPARPIYCRSATSIWSSPCRPRSLRSLTRTRR